MEIVCKQIESSSSTHVYLPQGCELHSLSSARTVRIEIRYNGVTDRVEYLQDEIVYAIGE